MIDVFIYISFYFNCTWRLQSIVIILEIVNVFKTKIRVKISFDGIVQENMARRVHSQNIRVLIDLPN